jgi:hypothetical protein
MCPKMESCHIMSNQEYGTWNLWKNFKLFSYGKLFHLPFHYLWEVKKKMKEENAKKEEGSVLGLKWNLFIKLFAKKLIKITTIKIGENIIIYIKSHLIKWKHFLKITTHNKN